jgi:hypothetical protein
VVRTKQQCGSDAEKTAQLTLMHSVEQEMKRITVFFFLMALCIASFAEEGAESTFPSGTKLSPAKKVELILNEKEYVDLDYPSRPCVLDDMVNMIPNEKVLVEAEVKEGRLANLQHVDKNEHPERTIELEFTQNLVDIKK